MPRFLRALTWIGFVFSSSVAAAGMHPSPPSHPMASLLGAWEGTGDDGKRVRISYELTSNGTALLETITPETEPTMTTLYYVDGHHLMLTHYCSLGNQPRMVSDLPAGEIKRLSFAFLDATNLGSPTDPHMHKMTLTIQDPGHMTQTWTLSQDGRETAHLFTLVRQP